MIAASPRRLARRLNAKHRRRGLAGSRLFLLEEAVSGVKTGLALLAEVESGAWDVAFRDFEQGAVEGIELTVGVSDDLTPAMLARARGWAVVEDGADEGAIYKADLGGVPALSHEPAWRLRSTGRLAGTYSLTGDTGAENAILAEAGVELLAAAGDPLIWSAA